jgi:hypothetical protein
MTPPRQFLIRMIAFLVAVAIVCGFLFFPLRDAFMANAALNGLILGVFLAGIVYNFREVTSLNHEVIWIENFRRNQSPLSAERPPKLIAPMAAMLGERKGKLSLSTVSTRSILDGIASRLDESRDISRYSVGLLIFLGLLGTFWGLMQTVGSIGAVINGLTVASGDLAAIFDKLKTALETPLKGMGTAFTASLFGLSGSLVLGFLDLQVGQAQNRFYNDLEDWLAGLTRLSSGALSGVGDGDQAVPAYVQALLEQTAESLENLQRTLGRGEENRISDVTNMRNLVAKLEGMTDHMRTSQTLMVKLAENQIEMKPILAKIADSAGTGAIDESTRAHIRNLDVYMARLLEEMSTGRDETIQQIRSEIKLLARTVAAKSDAGR